MDSSSLLPAILSAYQNATKPGQSTASASDARKALQDFNTMLRVTMDEQLTSMLAASNTDDGSSSTGSSDPLGSALSGLSSMSSLLSQLNTSGSAGNNSSLMNSLLASANSGEMGGTASMLANLLTGSGTNGANSLLSSLSGAENPLGINALAGVDGSSNNDLSGLLGSLPGLSTAAYQQLLSHQNQNAYQSVSQNKAVAMLPMDAQDAHINQFVAELDSGGSGVNADCGPTSLVMALHEMGLRVAGETSSSTPGQSIDLARLTMSSSPAKDGVDSNGNYSVAEHNTYTDFNDIKNGAQAAGAKTLTLNPNSADIMHALQEGGRVIVSGTFTGKNPLPWTGDRGFDNQTAPGNAAGHFVEVSSYDPFTKLFTINDPARSAPHQVSAATLDYFMSGNAGAMSLRA